MSDLVPLPIICGPTAAGKTGLAAQLARNFPFEVVSADSRQVYRLMDIGTAKPTAAEQAQVRHHLIDVVWPDEEFNASLFVDLAKQAISEITSRGHRPLLVGGTGLYIRALTEGLVQAPGAAPELREQLARWADEAGGDALHRRLQDVDPQSAKRLHPNDRLRIIRALEVFEQTGRTLSAFQAEHRFGDRPYRTLKIGLTLEREELYCRVDSRAEQMFESGLLDETEQLLTAGYNRELKSLQTIGYRQAIEFLSGECTREEALVDLQRATRRYARQQLTWLRQDKSIKWVDSSADFDKIHKFIEDFYAG